jgi:RHS repeat-associated protein
VSLLNPETFALDGASNVTSRSGVAEVYDAANRLTADGGTTNTWSNADRLVQRGAADSFVYDALDRLTNSTVAGSARTYAYNGDGLLQSRTGAGATSFLWDPSTSPSRELRQGSDNIVYGLGPLYVVKGDGSTLSFARDGGKSVRAQVTSAGATSASFRYKAYGQIAQSNGAATPSYLGYAGQLLDPSGLYYMRARWYDAATGRFWTRDPVNGDPATPLSVNSYAYAYANPVLLSDPSGLCIPCHVIHRIISQYTVGVEADAAIGAGPWYVHYNLGIAHAPDGTWGAFATNGRGEIAGATVSIGPRVLLSNAPTVQSLSGPFDSVGSSVGEGVQVSTDVAVGSDAQGREIRVLTFGPSLGLDISPIYPFFWELHHARTDTIVEGFTLTP